jgi:hypothetical protein
MRVSSTRDSLPFLSSMESIFCSDIDRYDADDQPAITERGLDALLRSSANLRRLLGAWAAAAGGQVEAQSLDRLQSLSSRQALHELIASARAHARRAGEDGITDAEADLRERAVPAEPSIDQAQVTCAEVLALLQDINAMREVVARLAATARDLDEASDHALFAPLAERTKDQTEAFRHNRVYDQVFG